MRTAAYLILAYIALGAQVGLAQFLSIGGAPPNLVLIAALFIALNAPKEAALLGCFGLGLMQDLLTQQSLGVFAFSYGLIGLLVMATQNLLFREHPLTHVILGFVGSLICMIILIIYDVRWFSSGDRTGAGKLLAMMLYTTILSPIVLYFLQRIRKSFGFQRRRITA
jgi:rod shape-determining protein MreD